MTKYYYAVKEGKMPGVYETWAECEKQVRGYSGAKFKKFSTYEEAFKFTNPSEVVATNNKDLDKKKDATEKRTSKDQNKSKKKVNKREEKSIKQIDLKENEAIAYVDGSFDIANFTYSYGVVFITKEGKETFSGREDDMELAQMRNVSGEIKGAMVAMEIALKEEKDTLYLHFDYTGIRDWAKGNWKTNKEGTKNYKSFYDSIKDKLDVKFIKVKAHSGVEYNEEADKLAKEAIID